ncbi:hypothetical protein [Streptomyces sp. PSAA01]|nr:hypothetical protein [Streptomyces sp. PSAA01]MCG0286218.1 hypothetical protein [Streptomyces sp. PSAA01]
MAPRRGGGDGSADGFRRDRCRVAARASDTPDSATGDLGFRTVRDT